VVPHQNIIDSVPGLIAADTAFLGVAAVKHVHLIKEAFTPSPAINFPPTKVATFDGYATLNAASGSQQSFTDPVSGNQIVQLIEPLGGWHWLTTGGTNLPQTIYGYFVTDLADAVTLGCGILDTPVILTATGQAIDIAQIRITVRNPFYQ
jgi:hypothetical protein